MTRREFFAGGDPGYTLRALVPANRLPYNMWLMHVCVSAQTMFVKAALMSRHLRKEPTI